MAGASSTSCYLVEIALDARGPGPVKGLGIDGVGEKVVELDVHSSQGTYAWCRRMGPKVPRARSLVESGTSHSQARGREPHFHPFPPFVSESTCTTLRILSMSTVS